MNSYFQARYEKDFMQTVMDMREWLKLGQRIELAVQKRLKQAESADACENDNNGKAIMSQNAEK